MCALGGSKAHDGGIYAVSTNVFQAASVNLSSSMLIAIKDCLKLESI